MKKSKKVVIIGAAGCIGEFVASELKRLLDFSLLLIDVAYEKVIDNQYPYDVTKLTTEQKETLFVSTDILIIALPYDVLAQVLESVILVIPKHVLIVDVCPSKMTMSTYYDNVLNIHNHPILSLHPLFRPGLDLKSKPIAYFTKNSNFQTIEFIASLKDLGWDMFESSPEEQDKVLSTVQVSTHILILIFSKMIMNSEVPFERLIKFATPPFKIFLILAYRILSGYPKTYWDIQSDNKFGSSSRSELVNTLNEFNAIISCNDFEKFSSLFQSIQNAVKLDDDTSLQMTFNKMMRMVELYFEYKQNNYGHLDVLNQIDNL